MKHVLHVVLFASLAASPAAAAGTALRVTVDQAKLATLPDGVASLVIGNPAVADVTLLKAANRMVLTGRGYGETNLVALDAAGRIVEERQVFVDPPTHALVVQRGNVRESYSCDPVCMPTAILGDDTKRFGDVSGQVSAHDQLAKGGAGGSNGGGSIVTGMPGGASGNPAKGQGSVQGIGARAAPN